MSEFEVQSRRSADTRNAVVMITVLLGSAMNCRSSDFYVRQLCPESCRLQHQNTQP